MRFKKGEDVIITETNRLVQIKSVDFLNQRYDTSNGKTYSESELISFKESTHFRARRWLFYFFLVITFLFFTVMEYGYIIRHFSLFTISLSSNYFETIHIGGLISIGWIFVYSFCFYNRNGLFNPSYTWFYDKEEGVQNYKLVIILGYKTILYTFIYIILWKVFYSTVFNVWF